MQRSTWNWPHSIQNQILSKSPNLSRSKKMGRATDDGVILIKCNSPLNTHWPFFSASQLRPPSMTDHDPRMCDSTRWYWFDCCCIKYGFIKLYIFAKGEWWVFSLSAFSKTINIDSIFFLSNIYLKTHQLHLTPTKPNYLTPNALELVLIALQLHLSRHVISSLLHWLFFSNKKNDRLIR